MELIFSLFQAYTTAREVANAYGMVSDWVVEKVNRWSWTASSSTIEKQVIGMEKATEAQIRKVAEKAFDESRDLIPRAERDVMIALANNMARNVRARRSYGPLDGSFMRSERLLDLMLRDVEPKRHRGEKIAPGSPWVLERHLGMGSFGEVWLAVNPGFPIPRAYKFFTQDVSGEWLKREQESLVEILKRLGEHDNIVDFRDADVGPGYPYLGFEYCAGGSLEEWIIKDKDRRPDLATNEIIRQVASGLAAAHAQDIFHRDIKPANILLADGPDVGVKIGDFGLAKIARSNREGGSRLASMAGLVGTELYLPPESQLRSKRRNPAQYDIFALGVVWYQLAVGAIERPPYDFASRLKEKGLDSHTISLVERCLARPDRRFAHAGKVLESMGNLIPPPKEPIAPGKLNVQYLAIEYLSSLAR